MVVWVVLKDSRDGDSYTIKEIFDSEDKAKKYIKKTQWAGYGGLSYEQWHVL